MSDLSDLVVVITMMTKDALDSAKSLLALTELAQDESQVRAASAGTVVAAIAHLARTTEMALVSHAANELAADGGTPRRQAIERRLPIGLWLQVEHLVKVVHGSNVVLDRSRPMVKLLRAAIRLRNNLIHKPGEYVMGTAAEVGATYKDGRVIYEVPSPSQFWKEVSPVYARSVVEAVEAYGEAVLMAEPGVTALDSRLLLRHPPRTWAGLPTGADSSSSR